ncbi:TIGR04255 family protein [Kitasatospora sp. NPDC048239]|uniref:TIGR04255 family protein n=1 Tax=Kitasatospora sp. NPDC048239 TaxID=3364046 RepID=UPI003712FADB
MATGLFSDLPAPEVPLTRAPLTRVLAQIKFPSAPDLTAPEGQRELAKLLRNRYPVARQQAGINLVITPNGVVQQPDQNVVRQLHSKDSTWMVSYSDNFVSLETSSYESRRQFRERLEEVLSAISKTGDPVLADRIGIRYINQITGHHLSRLHQYLRPETQAGLALGRMSKHATLVQSVTESLYAEGNDRMLIRQGWVPARAMMEPTIPVLESDSWVIDLDSFTDGPCDFTVSDIGERAEQLASGAYRAFRALITDEFLQDFI